ncbi:hypothetical protein THAOC_22072 [Thalassiosira oceanica]|uniref:MYND-type domain-containing protein n=1 Tax=Thalassiosira oceanica TaxID=159749 RepID=K0SA74_THAOC|nr:hypothetical protein THAOC_22072 [Thalassiosira oceanica]|eukprot:EJK57846.1 hypothetical protein THAOC_22072 [Thalassiosira oceanica]
MEKASRLIFFFNAHPDVFNIMLQMLDDGQVTDSKGTKVDFKNCIIIFTSNIGSQDIIDLGGADGDQELMKERVTNAMRENVSFYMSNSKPPFHSNRLTYPPSLQFRPEFLNRIDEQVIFNSLNRDSLRGIVVLEAKRLEARLAEKSMRMIISDDALDFLADIGFDPVYGARPLKRTIQKELENNIAIGILNGEYTDGDTIVVGLNEIGRIGVRKAESWEVSDVVVDSSSDNASLESNVQGAMTGQVPVPPPGGADTIYSKLWFNPSLVPTFQGVRQIATNDSINKVSYDSLDEKQCIAVRRGEETGEQQRRRCFVIATRRSRSRSDGEPSTTAMSCIAVDDGSAGVCANCGKHGSDTVKLKDCAACRLVKYCGVDCQRAHRKQHKKACKQRASELKDEKLYSQGHERPERDFCPICTLPIPLPMGEHSMINVCCMQRICNGCNWAAQKRGMYDCAFCRAPISKNDADTLAMIQARVAKKDPEAIENLGQKYFFGELGLEKDMRKAVELFTKAAELGSIQALFGLGDSYDVGNGVEQDKAKAYAFYEKAAMQGHVQGRHNLGHIEAEKGNPDRAVRHWLISANMGEKASVENIKRAFTRGLATKAQYAEALKGYQDAVEEMKSHDRNEAKRLGYFGC